MARVIVFIDGFNVYHALEGERGSRHCGAYRKYKWLDYAALARCYVGGKDEIRKVYLFTALATWNPDKVNRHQQYLYVLRRRGVEVVLGKFKRKNRFCLLCRKEYRTYEEKLTDVNIAVQMFKGAMLDEYDRAILISGDTDIIPAIRTIHEVFPGKEIGVVIPMDAMSEDLRRECDFHFQMKEDHLARSQLPDEIPDAIHGTIRRPPSWT
jgi:uncharacterized LabA/DUF88 family protein